MLFRYSALCEFIRQTKVEVHISMSLPHVLEITCTGTLGIQAFIYLVLLPDQSRPVLQLDMHKPTLKNEVISGFLMHD